MYPKIKIDPGKGHSLIELQKSLDTDLQTENKTVIGAINEINEQLGFQSSIASVSNEFIIDKDGKLSIQAVPMEKVTGLQQTLDKMSVSEVSISRLTQNAKEIFVLNCNDEKR